MKIVQVEWSGEARQRNPQVVAAMRAEGHAKLALEQPPPPKARKAPDAKKTPPK